MRSPHLLLACALVLAPIAGVPLSATEANTPTVSGSETGSPGTIERPINNSVSHLAVNSTQIKNTSIETVTLDAGGTVAFDGSTYRQEIRKKQFDAALENTSDNHSVVNSALNRTESRLYELQERQKKAIKNYNNGMSAQAFLHELAAISAEAEQMNVFVQHVRLNSQRTGSSRALQLKQEFIPLIGSVRPVIKSTLTGDAGSPKRFFVRTSAQGVVLATVDDGQYIREVYLSGARGELNATRSYNRSYANNVIDESYPSIDIYTEDVKGVETNLNSYGFGLYPEYRSTEIYPYIDRSTGEIFYEYQKQSISDKHTVRGPQNTSGPFTLETNTTYTGGYMIVRVNDPKTDAEPNGTITVDGETVGTTEDGELYMLQPPNGITINATVDGETVSVTVGKPMGPPESGLSIREERRNKWQQLGNILF